MEHKTLSFQEFKKVFNMLKRNKTIRYDDLNFNVIIDSANIPLFEISRHSLKK